MDVGSLISAWDSIRSTIPPEIAEAIRSSRGPNILDMTRTRETWEVFVCLVGYYEEHGFNPRDMLREIERHTIQHQESEVVNAFLRYSSEFKTISDEKFLSEAIRLNYVFSAQYFVALRSSLDTLQECLAKYQDWEDIWRCVREAGGSNSASASASGASG